MLVERPMTKNEALECLEMFLHKQCSLGRMSNTAWTANDVWEAVNIAYEALEQAERKDNETDK